MPPPIFRSNTASNGWGTAVAADRDLLAAAAFLGVVTLRTREFVFSLVTYAAAVVAYEIAFNWDAIGGSDGIVGIAALEAAVRRCDIFGRQPGRPLAGRLRAAAADACSSSRAFAVRGSAPPR